MELITALYKAAPQVGDEFHARNLQIHVDDCDKYNLQALLHKLRDEGKIIFTGRLMTWKRIA